MEKLMIELTSGDVINITGELINEVYNQISMAFFQNKNIVVLSDLPHYDSLVLNLNHVVRYFITSSQEEEAE
ncbi:hypothetical protein P8843_06945 [Bacillus inaquosorum]|uniref:hypothetical protein n=1 Tax=Bacillus TaxID=1386 RepID=UPI001CDCAF83|nr:MULTISPECIES: hypothetical protein [Bacillus]MCY7977470.1 hypothetical protein [Bacillus inaquosorum]MCY9273517.1 hypothetical protein [Bacillus inaquosorum]MEC0589965.1 hypothetical protein [Bacillus inaquosorum]